MGEGQPGLFTRPPSVYHVGTSGWTYPHWREVFYPAGLAQSHWLAFYAAHFDTVEINATFYRQFRDPAYPSWRRRAPERFTYVLKAPRSITHERLLVDVGEEVQHFKASARLLEDKLGAILIQVAPATPFDPDRLDRALAAFDLPGQIAVEFRSDQWLVPAIRGLLERRQAIFVNVDSPISRLAEPWVTTGAAYFRLHGRGSWYAYHYSAGELDEIASHARTAADRGAKQVYLFFNNDDKGSAPQNALALKKLLE